MAVLTTNDYKTLWRFLYRSVGKDLCKALPNLPSEQQIMAMFQAMEDRWVASQSAYKADIDTALGVTTSNALAKAIGWSFVHWKDEKANN